MGLKDRIHAVLRPPGTQPAAPKPSQPAGDSPPTAAGPAPPPPAPPAPAPPAATQQAEPPASQADEAGRPSGGLRARMQRRDQLAAALPSAPAPQATQLPLPSQQHTYKEIDGRWQRMGLATRPAAEPPAQGSPPPAAQPARHLDGIDRAAATAQVVLSASQDDFDFDASDALRRAAASGRAAGAPAAAAGGGPPVLPPSAGQPPPPPQQQQFDPLNELDDLLLAGVPKPRGKRAGTAASPGARARRAAAAAAKAEAGGGNAGGGKAGERASGGQAGRRGAAPKRRRQLAAEVEGEGGGGSEGLPDALADAVLLPPDEPAAPPEPHQQQQQQEQRQQPIAATQQAPAQAPAAAASPQQPPDGAGQGQQQVGAPARANAPSDGPTEELRMTVGPDGEPWPADAPEEPYLDYAVPAAINRYLRQYQRDGICFLMRQYARGTGGILADDMGLGKTVQAIAFIAAVLGKTGGPNDASEPPLQPLPDAVPLPALDAEERWGLEQASYAPDYSTCWPVLVVAPTSVLTNWEREFAMWGKFRLAVCASTHRDSAVADIKKGQKEVMIISYHTLRTAQEAILAVPWHLVLFDEAHTLKNVNAQIYKAAARMPTRLRYGLTGTPFQNDYAEVWGVLDLMVPRCLGERRAFTEGMARPMMLGQKASSTDAQKAAGAKAQAELRAVLSRYMLRRTKKLIAGQMPTKRDYAVFCELSPLQLAAYRRLLESPDAELMLNYRQPCLECDSGMEYYTCCGWKVDADHGGVLWPLYHLCECDNEYDKYSNPKGCKRHKPEGCWRNTIHGFKRMCPFCLVLPTCSILRKVSNHLELVKARHEDRVADPVKFEKAVQVAQLVIGEDEEALGGYVTTEGFIRLQDTATCGKMEVLASLLAEWHRSGGNKVLLFSNSVQMLNIIRCMVTAKGYPYVMLDGSVKQDERQPMCDAFNNSPSTFLFLISTLAGGVGLNLTAANKVVIVDPSWNPAMDLQAQDRAFRIGQKRDVSVYRLIAAGTMEEIIYDRQLYKQMHSEMVLEGVTDMPRTFEGAKTGAKADHGELWGMVNLLRQNRDSITTLDLVERERRRRQGGAYRLQEYDAEGAAREAAAATGAGGGADAAPSPGRRRGGGAAEVGDGEDVGLQALVEAELGLLPEEAPAGASPGPRPRPGSHPGSEEEGEEGEGSPGRRARAARGLLAAEQEAEERPEEHRAETELIAKSGVTGMFQHRLAFKPSAAETAATRAAIEGQEASTAERHAEMAAAATRDAAKRPRTERSRRTRPADAALSGGGRVQLRPLPLLQSLADAMGVPAAAAAVQLLGMTPEARSRLREEYARQDDPRLPPGAAVAAAGS